MNEEAPPFDDLNIIRQKVNELFNILCFSHGYSVEFIEYSSNVEHPPGTDTRTDIERILDNIAYNSPLINMPEEQKEFWPHYRQNLSEDDIKIMNSYRRKFKLNPI